MYRSGLAHSCQQSPVLEGPKLSDELKKEIIEMLKIDKRMKPLSIFKILNKKGFDVPQVKLIYSYLANVKQVLPI